MSKKEKLKTLYKFNNHPYVTLKQKGNYLILNFEDSFSSYSHWHTIKFYYVKELNQWVQVENSELKDE